MGSLKIYASLTEHISEGFVWLKIDGISTRGIVKITNPCNGKSIFCEALKIERNFLKSYNQSPRYKINSPELTIVMNGWYRSRLGGLTTQHEYPLQIEQANSWFGRIQACWHHPKVTARIAVLLGFLSVSLGVIGLILGVISIFISFKAN